MCMYMYMYMFYAYVYVYINMIIYIVISASMVGIIACCWRLVDTFLGCHNASPRLPGFGTGGAQVRRPQPTWCTTAHQLVHVQG